MPNIKSSILSVKTDAMRRAKNVSAKSAIKTASRKVLDAVAAGNAEEAKALLVIACKKIAGEYDTDGFFICRLRRKA